jgi:hypothetical protein
MSRYYQPDHVIQSTPSKAYIIKIIHAIPNVINHRTAGTTEPPLRRENHRIPEAI